MWEGIQIGDNFIIPSFGIMIFLAFISCNYFIRKTLKEKNIDTEIGDNIIFWAAIGGILLSSGVAKHLNKFALSASNEGNKSNVIKLIRYTNIYGK